MLDIRNEKFLKAIFVITAVVAVLGSIRTLVGLSSTKQDNITLESCGKLCYPNTVYSVEYGHCKCNPAVNVKQ